MLIIENGILRKNEYGVLLGLFFFIGTMMVFIPEIIKNDWRISFIQSVFLLALIPFSLCSPYVSKIQIDHKEFIWKTRYIILYRNLQVNIKDIVSVQLNTSKNDEVLIIKWICCGIEKEVKIKSLDKNSLKTMALKLKAA
jgi:hypothetical protein